MRRFLLWLSILVVPILTMACGTPVSVKQLSVAQINYYDTAMKAVQLQSEALILAAEKIKMDAEQRIKERQEERRVRIEDAIVTIIPTLNKSERETEIKRLLADSEEKNRSTTQALTKLSDDLNAIKSKTQELQNFIAKMKAVQISLDAYLQSEQAGEKVTQTVLQQPTLEKLLDTVNNLSPQVSKSISDLSLLIQGL